MIKYIISILLCYGPVFGFQYTLSICAIFQDEAPYLKEWIDYHQKVGVEHFWLYNNLSQDNYKEVLQPYCDQGIVELIEWPLESNEGNDFYFRVQIGAYNNALTKSKNVSKWLAIIDIDEFIVPKIGNNIAELLESKYSWCSGVCINWQCFGTSHIEKCPEGEITKYLIMKMKWDDSWNTHYKSIVQPLHVTESANPHYCHYLPTHWHVNTHYEKVELRSPVYLDVMQINHYWTRDEWYLHNVKIPRYNKWVGKDVTKEVLETANLMNKEIDSSIINL